MGQNSSVTLEVDSWIFRRGLKLIEVASSDYFTDPLLYSGLCGPKIQKAIAHRFDALAHDPLRGD